MSADAAATDVLDFWFGELDEGGMPSAGQRKLWFQSSQELDRAIAGRFDRAIGAALAGELDHWAETDQGLVALVILLDQFTRNVYRGTEQAFSGDPRALELASAATSAGRDRELPVIHRVFLYMPFEHSEDLAAQEQGLACFDRLLADCPESARGIVADFRRYMVAHADVIRQFGRFPHRNAILGRPSTPEESTYLATHGGF